MPYSRNYLLLLAGKLVFGSLSDEAVDKIAKIVGIPELIPKEVPAWWTTRVNSITWADYITQGKTRLNGHVQALFHASGVQALGDLYMVGLNGLVTQNRGALADKVICAKFKELTGIDL